MMIDRSLFTPDGSNPPHPVPFGDDATVPTKEMAEILRDACGEAKSVLEIGTGSGYQTAVLAEKFPIVVSIECFPVDGAGEKLPANVVLIHEDGLTFSTGEEFGAVLVTFASTAIAQVWLEQLEEGGRLIIPLKVKNSAACRISVYEKRGGKLRLIDIPCYAPFTAAQETHNA